MQLPVSDAAIDKAKQTIGSLFIAAAAMGEIFATPGTKWDKAAQIAGMIGTGLLGLGLLNARAKSYQQLLVQVFGTSNTHEIAPHQVEAAARNVSMAPPASRGDFPADRTPPPPRSAA